MSYDNKYRQMSSYVAVVGTPSSDFCSVFGLTPQEVRYLKGKFTEVRRHDQINSQNPHHGIRIEATSIVVLNALGYIGFKVVTTCGDSREYIWTMERNLDVDTHFSAVEQSYNE